MNRNHNNPDGVLDDVTESIRTQEPDAETVAGAAARVRSQLAEETSVPVAVEVDHIGGCDDFQALISAYLRKDLSKARTLLFEDHMSECLPCRKALKQARSGKAAPAIPLRKASNSRPSRRRAYLRMGLAAALAIAFVLPVLQYIMPFGGSIGAVVEAADGRVYRIEDAASQALTVGDSVAAGERIRTAHEAGAVVRLTDGTKIEMAERSELSVSESMTGATIHLDRGSVIVEAADQRNGKLYIATPTSLVTVAGTVLSVHSGVKGTRVSMVEGSATVESAGLEHRLAAGEQFTTTPVLERVPLAQDVAWSRNADRYLDTLGQVLALRQEIDRSVARPDVRFSSRLLDLAPENTVLYVALPNISSMLGQAQQILDARMNENPALREWWETERKRKGDRAPFGGALEQIQKVGSYLGPEVVVALQLDERGEPGDPVVMAEVADAAGLRAFIEQHASQGGEKAPNVLFVDDPTALTAGAEKASGTSEQLVAWIADGIAVFAPNAERVRGIAEARAQGAKPFAASPFYAPIAETYSGGVSFLLAADLNQIIKRAAKKDDDRRGLERLGFSDLKYFIATERGSQGMSNARAVVTFNGERRGIASWLAAPGPMGALSFISPDANIVAAFVVNEPASLVDDLIGFINGEDPEAVERLRQFEIEHGVSLRDDIAAPLGGEFAFAIDGPILPTPSWKMVFEVYDAERLQQTFQKTVTELNRLGAAEGHSFTLVSEESGGRTYHVLKSGSSAAEVHYAFANGYMIAAPSRALVERAIRYRESGYTLATSQRFLAALPEDGNPNVSALFYNDLAALISNVAKAVPGASEKLGELGTAAESLPTLACAYAWDDRIEFVASSEGGPFGLNPSTLVGVPGSFELQNILRKAMKEK